MISNSALDKKAIDGRELGYLWRAPDGLFVNLELVRRGRAKALTKYPFDHLAIFVEWEAVARRNGRGIWKAQEDR